MARAQCAIRFLHLCPWLLRAAAGRSGKATQERAVRGADGRDWTQYVITGPAGETEPLRKREAVLAMVTTPHAAGVPARQIAQAIAPSRFLSVDGTVSGTKLREAFALTYAKFDPGRWFLESPIHDEGRTWIVTKMWGRNTESVQDMRGLGLARRSTATSCRSASISASLADEDRASSASQDSTVTSSR
jgi:hypothetical protein